MTVQLGKRTLVFAIFLSLIGIGRISHASQKTPTLSALYTYSDYDGKLDIIQWDIQTRQVTRQFRFALSRPTAYVSNSPALVLDSTNRSMYYIDMDFGNGSFRVNAQLMRFRADDNAPEAVFEAENLWGIYPSPDRRTALLTQRPDYPKGLPHPYCVYDFATGVCTKVSESVIESVYFNFAALMNEPVLVYQIGLEDQVWTVDLKAGQITNVLSGELVLAPFMFAKETSQLYLLKHTNFSRSKIGLESIDRDFIACTKGAFNGTA